MAFPTSPTNGQITIVGGVAYQYATTTNSWGRIVSTANVITANVITVDTLTANTLNVNNNLYNIAGNISATGNITGNYILGNGSQLTGIATGSISNITNGTSNITIASSGGNATVNIGGTADVAVFAVTGEYVTGVVSASGNVTGGNILTGGLISATGALSVTGATTLTTVSTGNISAGNVYSGGSITTGSLISAVGNVTADSGLFTNIVNVASHTGAVVSVSGNVTANNGMFTTIVNTASHTGAVVSVSGNVTGGNANITGATASTSKTTGALQVAGGVGVAGDIYAGNSVVVDGGAYGNVTTTQFASVFGSGAGANPRSIMQVRGADGVAGIGIQGTSGSDGQIYANTGIIFTTGATVRDKDFPTGGTTRATIDSTGLSVTGIVSATGNVNAGNVVTGGLISAAGNVTSGASINTVNLSVSGNVLGNLLPSANVTYDLGSPSQMWRTIYVSGNTIVLGTANLSVSNGNLSVGDNPVVTVSPTGTSNATGNMNVIGNITGSNITTAGLISAASNITGGNILTGGLISVTGNVTAGNVSATNFTGLASSATLADSANAVAGANVSGQVANALVAGTVYSAAQPNITSVGTLTSLAVTGNATANNGIFTTSVNTASFTGTTVSVTGNVAGSYFVGNGSQLTGIASGGGGITWTTVANTAPGNAAPGDFWYNSFTDIKYQYTNDGTGNFWVDQSYPTSFSTLAVTGNITGGNISVTSIVGTLTTAAQPNITSVGTLTSVTTSGVVTVNSGAAATAIVNGAGNAVGNIGSSGTYFNRLFAQATTALYADLAEVYKSDAEYPPGTVLVFGGSQEVTISTVGHDARIAGVVSTNPAHVMNSGLVSEYTVDVGLIGRVPCQVIGPIAAGDRVVSSNRAGVAERLDMQHYQPGVIIGKAVESYNSTDVGTIEIVVGRL